MRNCLVARRHDGFTLIELMVAVGIVAILALMAIPSYQHKLVRDQVLETLPLADLAKTPIATAWTLTQTFPANNAQAGLPAADRIVSNLVSALSVQGGAIHITFGNRANGLIDGKMLTLRPAVVEGAPIVPVAWICGYAPVPGKMTAMGANRTDIPSAYLPYRCRPD